MATITFETVQRDHLAMAVASAITLANETALQQGTDPASSLVTITEDWSSAGRRWRIHYGRRDYVGRRGGDLIVLVDEKSGRVESVMRGQ
jgi:hypothetical protein